MNPRDRLALGRALRTRRGVGAQAVARVLGAAERHDGDLLATCLDAQVIAGLRGRQALAVEGFGRALHELAEGLERRGVGHSVVGAALASGLTDALARERSERSEEQLERLRRFCLAAQRYERDTEQPSLGDFLAQAALAAGDDQQERPAAVTLSTLHAAKGCEWDHVRLVGLCEGLLPHRRALARGELEEERRLAYVGMTRAWRELSLSWPARYRGSPVWVSRFVFEAGVGALASARQAPRQPELIRRAPARRGERECRRRS